MVYWILPVKSRSLKSRVPFPSQSLSLRVTRSPPCRRRKTSSPCILGYGHSDRQDGSFRSARSLRLLPGINSSNRKPVKIRLPGANASNLPKGRATPKTLLMRCTGPITVFDQLRGRMLLPTETGVDLKAAAVLEARSGPQDFVIPVKWTASGNITVSLGLPPPRVLPN